MDGRERNSTNAGVKRDGMNTIESIKTISMLSILKRIRLGVTRSPPASRTSPIRDGPFPIRVKWLHEDWQDGGVLLHDAREKNWNTGTGWRVSVTQGHVAFARTSYPEPKTAEDMGSCSWVRVNHIKLSWPIVNVYGARCTDLLGKLTDLFRNWCNVYVYVKSPDIIGLNLSAFYIHSLFV